MGFFTDLKEDISLAMNELVTEDTSGEAEKEISLEEMLQNIDNIVVPDEPEEEKEQDVPEGENGTIEEPEIEELDLEQQLRAAFGQEEAEDEVAEDAPEGKEEKAEEKTTEEKKAEEKKEGWSVMKNQMERDDEISVISSSMKIKGDILSEASLNVLGNVKGSVEVLKKLSVSGVIEGNATADEIFTEQARIQGDLVSSGPAKIGSGTVVIGNITATSAVIAGAVKGDIDVHGPVVLDSTAVVMGNIKSEAVQINSGAVIEGMCSQCYANVNPAKFFDGLDMNESK